MYITEIKTYRTMLAIGLKNEITKLSRNTLCSSRLSNKVKAERMSLVP
jgi:hypothetical protein